MFYIVFFARNSVRHAGHGQSNDARMEDQLGQVKAELVAEKEAREALEVRVRQLENSPPTMTESVDKPHVVIGGLEDLERKPKNLCRMC